MSILVSKSKLLCTVGTNSKIEVARIGKVPRNKLGLHSQANFYKNAEELGTSLNNRAIYEYLPTHKMWVHTESLKLM